MQISFQPVALDLDHGDGDAVLVFRDGRLLAVASRLGGIHGDEKGRWFIEAVLGTSRPQPRASFADLEEVRAWAAGAPGTREPAQAPMPRIEAR